MHAAVPAAHLECHARAAIVKVDAAPIPPRGLRCHVSARPFVVEPGAAFHVAAVQLADHLEMRAAVVVARLVRSMSLAAESLLALQDELPREEAHFQIEIARRDAGVVAIAVLLEAPVVDPYARALELDLRERESCARRALVVHQPAALGIA